MTTGPVNDRAQQAHHATAEVTTGPVNDRAQQAHHATAEVTADPGSALPGRRITQLPR